MQETLLSKQAGAGVSRWWSCSSALLALLLFAALGMAQLNTGNISGTVTDQSGGTAPGVNVTVRNVETGVTRSLQTNAAGRYDALALPVGNYEVDAQLAGFQRSVRSGITLTLGRTAVVDFVLQVGEVTQSVTITGEAAQVETTTATVTNLVDERRVLEIPLNNRDLTQLAFQNALVLRTPTGAPGTRNASGGTGDHLSVAGMRGNMNTYLLDGVSNADISGNSQSATTAYSGAETVKEFQVITNNYSAEYQSKPGAIVSAVTKSGTNQFHGSLFEFLRNDNLDAYSWAAKARQVDPVKPEFKRNQFGGSLGGPILRDKTFFFTSYEGLRERIGESLTFRVPTAAGRRGLLGPNLYDPNRPERFNRADFDAGITPIVVNPIVVPYLNLLPLPGEGGTALLQELRDPVTGLLDGRAEVSGPRNTQTTGDFAAVKVDHQFVDQRKGFLAFTWNIDNSVLNRVDAFPGQASAVGEETAKRVYSGRHTSIWTPTVLNEFVFGFTRTEPSQSHPVNEPDWANFNGVDLRFGRDRERMGQITFCANSCIENVGFPRDRSLFFQDFWTFRDNVSMTRTDHTLKFGAEINPIRLVMDQVGGSYNGVYNFDTFHRFLTADVLRLEQDVPAGTPLPSGQVVQATKIFSYRQTQMAFYFQDNWKVRPSLTLNLGLRYEFLTSAEEAENRFSNLVNITDLVPTLGVNFDNPTKRNFSPRIGFAWAPEAGGKSAVRGGFGVYYELPTIVYWRSHSQELVPFVVAGFLDKDVAISKFGLPGVAFPHGPETLTRELAQVPSYRMWENANHPSYVYRWSFSLEREFGNWFASAAYNGSRGVHLLTQADANQAKWDGYPNNPPNTELHWTEQLSRADSPTRAGASILQTPLNPSFNNIWVIAPRGSSFYHGLNLSVQRRLTAGLQMQASYNYSKNIDFGAGSTNQGDGLPQNQRIDLYWQHGRMKGLSLIDVRHNFVSSFTYDLPRTSFTGVLGAVVNGWQTNGVLTLSGGTPFTVYDSNNRQRDAMRKNGRITPNLIANGNTNPVTGNPDQWFDPQQFIPSTCRAGVYCYNGNVPDPALGFQVGYWGQVGSNTLISDGVANFDFSLSKNIPITESMRVQFRSEFFNLTNSPSYRIPANAEATPFNSNGTRTSTAGRIDSTRNSERQIQLALKFIF